MTIDERIASELRRHAPAVDEHLAWDRIRSQRPARARARATRLVSIPAAVLASLVVGVVLSLGPFSGPNPMTNPQEPFLGIWVTTDHDDSGQTMIIRPGEGETLEMMVHDDFAGVCSGAPSTMTGSGRVQSTRLVIPAPVLTCDDGTVPQAPSDLPLQDQLRDLTFVHHPLTDTLTDSFDLVWRREGAPSPEPTTYPGMWPQSSLEGVRQAQELADAGDPDYTWQVHPDIGGPDGDFETADIFARFIRDELGWEAFRLNPHTGSGSGGEVITIQGDRYWQVSIEGVGFIRCDPGRTNPLYPDDPLAGSCAPTIDEFRYETVEISVAQLVRRDPSGIWVVTEWQELEPFQQMTPPSDAEVTGLLQPYLQARLDGEGAEEYLDEAVPLLYATTTGTPYERYEFEPMRGPEWPDGGTYFRVRLFADGGNTVVEQFFHMDRDAPGPLDFQYLSEPEGPEGQTLPGTTENGRPVPELPRSREILDGKGVFSADLRWEGPKYGAWALWLDGNPNQRFHVTPDPHPIEFWGNSVDVQAGVDGCQPESAAANADALARIILSDPDLDATEPVTVVVGGIEALRMDVVATEGAKLCGGFLEGVGVVTETPQHNGPVVVGVGHRMRLYLLDLPEGMPARILAIAIVAPEDRFEHVLEAATPVVDSFQFHTGQ